VSHGSVRRLAVLVGAFALVAAMPLRANAADGKVDFAVGYALMHDSDVDGSFPVGWFATVGKEMTSSIAIVGDVSGNYKSIEVAPGVNASLKVHTFTAGPRWAEAHGQVTPWLQALVGIAHMTGSVAGFGTSDNGLAIVPGVGIDYAMANGMNLRFGGSFRMIRSSGTTGKEFQFIAGIVFQGR
jgi:Outer membrane protein beta-barrel domain